MREGLLMQEILISVLVMGMRASLTLA